ncbi:MAG: hypothetical protein L0207_05525 [Chlamydiae bacterium]|nr:hypothetical protein [Chlamydiota bacterium]
MKSSAEKVRAILWEIKSWVQFWSPLHKVEIFYDDGVHQDFSMFLEWQATNAYIRTVRFLDHEGNIAFFSPVAPPPMIVHHGLWQISASDNQSAELTAMRWFKLPLIERETLEEYQKRLKDFSESFVGRLENLLKCLGELCEKST